jgi:hypothetical protein
MLPQSSSTSNCFPSLPIDSSYGTTPGPCNDSHILQSLNKILGDSEVSAQRKAQGTSLNTIVLTATSIDSGGLGRGHRYPTMMDMLPDGVLLDVFDSCAYHCQWIILVHVCRRWRQIVFTSPHRLDIRLLCKPGTPVRTHLSCWPAFPILVQYGTKGLATRYEDNVLAALQHSNRVCELDLTIRTKQLEKLVTAMQAPYPALEILGLTFGRTAPVLPDGSFGGPLPHLRVLELDAVPFPTLPTFLASAKNLGELYLYNIPKSGYISPEALVAGLAVSTSLCRLIIEFKSNYSLLNQNSLPPVTRTVLPALVTIELEGASDYLEDLVARIDCPKLVYNKISYFHRRGIFRADQLLNFINRLEDPRVRQFMWLDVCFPPMDDICLVFFHLRHIISTWITFRGAKWGVSHLIHFFRQFSTKVSGVFHLSIKYERPTPEVGQNEWVQLLHPFTALRTLHVKNWVYNDPPAAEGVTGEMATGADSEMLPALGLLYLECGPQAAFLAFFENFVAARRLSSCPVTVVRCAGEFHDRIQPYMKEDQDDLLRMLGRGPETT